MDRAGWQDALAGMPPEQRDVYFLPAFHALDEREGSAFAFVFERGSHRMIVPGLRTAIPGTSAFDLQTPNGYGGPLLSEGAPAELAGEAWKAWQVAAAEDGIVAAFFRLHPLLGNRRWLPEDARILVDRKTVYVDLSRGLEPARKSAESRHRNMVNRARKEGVVVRWNEPEDWRAFEALYEAAMVRLKAEGRLRFDPAYFGRLRAIEGTELACTRDPGGLVAGHVFLWGPVWGHYHLAARRDDSPNFTMNLLMQAGLERAAARGLRGLHLGGGASTSADDGVLRFKRSLGGTLLDFEVALVVADLARYDALVSDWTRKEGRPPSWLLGYRQPRGNE